MNKNKSAIAGIEMSGIALLHVDDGYSRYGNFGGLLVLSTVLIY